MSSDVLSEIDALLVTNPTNIRYLTGFVGVSPEEREAFALVTHDKTYLFTNALYHEVSRALAGSKLKVIEISRENPISQELVKISARQKIKTLGFEAANLTVAEFTRLQEVLTEVALQPVYNRIETLRIKKRQQEITHIRAAATLTDQCFDYLLTIIKPGVTESAVVGAITTFFHSHAVQNAFAPIVAFGKHTSMPHYGVSHISHTACQQTDIVLLDFGAKVNGYCADMTRVVFVGTPKDEWIRAYTAVSDANTKALTLLKEGQRSGATLDAAAREVIAEANLPVYPHSLGHAVGLDIHEAPRLSVKKEEMLVPHIAVTVEPGVYIEGSYGVRIEDLVLIKNEGIEMLSTSTKTLTII